MCLYCSILLYSYPGHFFYKIFSHCILIYFKCISTIFRRIIFNRYSRSFSDYINFMHLHTFWN